MDEQTTEYRGWQVHFSKEGFDCAPMPYFDWPTGVNPVNFEIAQDGDWDTPADALKKAQQDIDRWWDDRNAETNV
ncbi:hypothetical protein [Azospirillum argentinense]|uniref:Uncharacterized protein n=1 Tax=Azospirillum brasilense TaxID=192 RepID=A0A4D8QKZ5_AZOBR|nr:hypothetical protein [Azospirillum argentinense]QCO07519.1 hypothetical protein D3867_37175 [Azospirillum argentinense]QCO07573.1 hypothetical protein D3867_37450 [Azospirillum argentinense]